MTAKWLSNVDCEHLRTIVSFSPSMYLASRVDGTILWANLAFANWAKYSLPELQKMTWMQLSVEDEDLAADIELAQQLSEYGVTYTVQKRYAPKNDKPQLGNLHVMRVPARGEIDFCFCRWEPLPNGESQALELALESQEKVAKEMAELTKAVTQLTSQTEEQKALLSVIKVAQKYPKITMAIFVLFLAGGGFDTALSWLQRLGYLPQPQIVVKEETKK